MKTLRLFLIACVIIVMQSCYEPGDIQVKNSITQVKIVDVKWGNIYIATELLPGESSGKLTIDKDWEKLPARHKISFKMTANDKSIYLETEEEFLLDEDDDLLIVLTDDTKVKTPNE
ncbi:hypothetical protein [Gaoshiqia sp. Z1-71]|uniref:hypothetical protein n=1 Tax=Gaoshiqia hydrogeniformans TaxID=3290090 RepID=UPI003BF83819